MQKIREYETTVLNTVSLHIIPFVFILYIVAFLDRVNLGYAAVTMNQDLGIPIELFGFLSGIFFIGYILFEVPSNLIMRRVGARVWIARILISWGLIAVATGFVQDSSQVIILRFFLGIAEAGFFPGMIWYLGTWFPPRRIAHSIALFMSAIGVSNVIGAPVSLFIIDTIHWFGIAGWRWLFILEGIPAVLLGILSFWVLKNSPRDVTWLNENEKSWLLKEINSGRSEDSPHKRLIDILVDRRVLICSVAYFAMSVGLYAIIFFLPTIAKNLLPDQHLSAVGIILVAVYGIALLSMILVSKNSDRTGERRYHTAAALIVGGIGLLIDHLFIDSVISLIGVSIALAGIFSMYGPFWSYVLAFLSEDEQPAGVAAINSIGNTGGFVGPMITGAVIALYGSIDSAWIIIAAILCIGGVMILFVERVGKHRSRYRDTS